MRPAVPCDDHSVVSGRHLVGDGQKRVLTSFSGRMVDRIIVDYNPDYKIGVAGHQDRRLRSATQVRERRERDKPDGQRIRGFYRLFADQAIERVALGLAAELPHCLGVRGSSSRRWKSAAARRSVPASILPLGFSVQFSSARAAWRRGPR